LTGFLEMASHGAGKIIKEAGAIKTIGIIIFLVGYARVFSYSWMKCKQTRFLLTVITLCGTLGVFGHSILAMAIPSSLCLLNMAIYNFASDHLHSSP